MPSSDNQTVRTLCLKEKSIMQLSPVSQSIVKYVEQRMSTRQDNDSNNEDKSNAENTNQQMAYTYTDLILQGNANSDVRQL